jgi:hypothetical protein
LNSNPNIGSIHSKGRRLIHGSKIHITPPWKLRGGVAIGTSVQFCDYGTAGSRGERKMLPGLLYHVLRDKKKIQNHLRVIKDQEEQIVRSIPLYTGSHYTHTTPGYVRLTPPIINCHFQPTITKVALFGHEPCDQDWYEGPYRHPEDPWNVPEISRHLQGSQLDSPTMQSEEIRWPTKRCSARLATSRDIVSNYFTKFPFEVLEPILAYTPIRMGLRV